MDMLGIVDQPSVYDCCRTCMTRIGNASFNIFKYNIQNISIAEILHSFTALTFNENDILPKVVCQQCYEKLNSFYEFIVHIENVDTKLKEVLKEKDHLSFERDLKKNFDFQEVTVEYTLQGNEGSFIKEENSEEENGALCTENNIFVGSGDKVELIRPCSLKYETEQEYLCKLCNKNFRNEKNYQRHNKKHLNFTKSNKCALNNSNLSKREIEIVTSEEGFICKDCNYSFNSKEALSQHLETCTNKISYENYSHLDNLYDYKTDSNEIEINPPEVNKNSEQIDPEEIKEENKIKCHVCSLVFKSQRSLSVHKQRNEVCNESDFISYQNEYTKENHLETTEKEGLVCEICHRIFRNKYSMSAHMRKHVEKGRILACPTCGKVFSKVNHLKRHRFLLHRDCNDASTHFQIKDTKHISTATEEGEFICKICKRRFKTKHSMSAHMRKHVEKGRTLSLSTCSKVFSKVNHLKQHQLLLLKDCNELRTNCQSKEANENILTGTEEGEFICEICKRRFKNRHSMSAHMRKHVEKGRVLSCSTCGKVFSKVSHLKRHQVLFHKDCNEISTNCQSGDAKEISTGTDEDEFVCEICQKGFKKKHSMSAHMRKHVEKGRVLSCSTCSKVFSKVSHLKRHEITHEDKPHFKCGICKKSYITEELLQQHSKQHKEAETCPVCQKSFTNMPALNTHIKVHTRSKLYLCSYCGKRFDSSTNLNQHYKRHIGIKTFTCSLCPRKFVTKGELTSHASTHTGLKPHKCKQCNASFTKNSSLVKHTHRHLGIKPYECDTCFKKFTTKGSLKLHYRIHTGEKPYSCDICARAFAQSNDLVKHRRRHLGEKLYKCEQCTESFRLKTELRHHISQHYITQLQETNMAAKHIDIKEINTLEEESSI